MSIELSIVLAIHHGFRPRVSWTHRGRTLVARHQWSMPTPPAREGHGRTAGAVRGSLRSSGAFRRWWQRMERPWHRGPRPQPRSTHPCRRGRCANHPALRGSPFAASRATVATAEQAGTNGLLGCGSPGRSSRPRAAQSRDSGQYPTKWGGPSHSGPCPRPRETGSAWLDSPAPGRGVAAIERARFAWAGGRGAHDAGDDIAPRRPNAGGPRCTSTPRPPRQLATRIFLPDSR